MAYLGVAALCLPLARTAAAVEVQVINLDPPAQGLNDTTARAPVGGNSGQTLGEQRLNAMRFAADFIGERLTSAVPIRIEVRFRAMQCGVGSAVLGSATTTQLVQDFPGAPRTDTFYPLALANALAGKRLLPGKNDIDALFNSALDRVDACLGGKDWYYGFDRATPGGNLNFVNTVIHELVHGLGFQSFVTLDARNDTAGEFQKAPDGTPIPDVFSRQIRDLSMPGQPAWPALTPAQRAVSATHGPDLVWDGNSTNSAAALLVRGTTQGRVQLYAPDPVQLGSSVSHWSSAVDPHQLLEPFATPRPIFNLGLAACALQDMGWVLSSTATGCSAVTQDEPPGPEANENDGAGTADQDGRSGGGSDALLPVFLFFALGWRLYRDCSTDDPRIGLG